MEAKSYWSYASDLLLYIINYKPCKHICCQISFKFGWCGAKLASFCYKKALDDPKINDKKLT